MALIGGVSVFAVDAADLLALTSAVGPLSGIGGAGMVCRGGGPSVGSGIGRRISYRSRDRGSLFRLLSPAGRPLGSSAGSRCATLGALRPLRSPRGLRSKLRSMVSS
jgi:hypothetical protein